MKSHYSDPRASRWSSPAGVAKLALIAVSAAIFSGLYRNAAPRELDEDSLRVPNQSPPAPHLNITYFVDLNGDGVVDALGEDAEHGRWVPRWVAPEFSEQFKKFNPNIMTPEIRNLATDYQERTLNFASILTREEKMHYSGRR